MSKKEYSKADKQAYLKSLRDRWTECKKLADNDQVAKAIHKNHCGEFSYYSFYFTLMDMKNMGLDGYPYIDCKTFKGWRDNGFMVEKGQKSVIEGITWVEPKDKDGNETDFVYPKVYKLFHRSQVTEVK